jgi:hypothetical protein
MKSIYKPCGRVIVIALFIGIPQFRFSFHLLLPFYLCELYYQHVNSIIFTRQIMETYRFRIVLINYLKNLCNLHNLPARASQWQAGLWIKCLFGCGFATLGSSVS